jgi:hypothetical protein
MKSSSYGMVLLTLASLALLACEADEPCGKGEKHVQGACVADDDAPSAGSSGKGSAGKGGSGSRVDAGMAGKDAGTGTEQDSGTAAECTEDRDDILGSDCQVDGDCNCAAPYCAKMPGQPKGVCTVFCEPDPDDCPDGYRCFDLSAIGVAGYEPFCIAK